MDEAGWAGRFLLLFKESLFLSPRGVPPPPTDIAAAADDDDDVPEDEKDEEGALKGGGGGREAKAADEAPGPPAGATAGKEKERNEEGEVEIVGAVCSIRPRGHLYI